MNIRSRYFRRYGLCRTAYEPLAFTSFLGLSVVLCCAIFRVVRTCPSEVTSPLVKDMSFGGGIRTLMGSYLVYPRTASPLRYHTRHHLHITQSAHMLVLARHFAFHVATVSSFTTWISRLMFLGGWALS